MNASHRTNRRFAPQTASTDEQRLRLVQSAYQLLAEKGMAGLRIREVASRIGLNHATLLYYFPTKEALIHAVVAFCIRQFEVIQTPRASSLSSPPNEQLRRHYLSDLAIRHLVIEASPSPVNNLLQCYEELVVLTLSNQHRLQERFKE